LTASQVKFTDKINNTAGIVNDFGHMVAVIIKSCGIFCKWFLALRRKEEKGMQSGCMLSYKIDG